MIQESKLRIVIDSRGAEKTAQRVRQELQGITTHGEYATKSMDAVSVGIRQLVGQMAGIVTVGAAINKMDVYTGINNKLKLVTNSQTELNQAMQDTFAIAQRSASSWSAVNDVYSKYMSNAKTLNLTQAQTARLTEITSKAVAISGSSTESAAGALFQYGQALDGNILRAEEYNSLVDGAGGLLSAMAKGLNVTRGELRQMMLDGKLTGEVITKALLKAGDSVDQLFNKTDTTVGQSLNVLSDSVTKFVGEAASGSGAATILAESIGVLAKNLDLVADVAVVGGVAMLTKTIVTQTIATHGSIAASVAKRNSLLSELEAQATLTAAEARRTASIAQYTQMQLADAKATAARMTGIQRLAYVQATVIPLEAKATQATAAHTAATNADTLAQEINNKARSRATMLLGMVGGPIGAITLGVAGLAAGYMYLQKRTAEANAKLEEQGKVAEKTKEELLALKGVQLDVTKDDLATSFKAQNEELHKLNLAFNGFIRTVKNANEGNQEVKEISDQVHKGLMSQADAIERLNKLKLLTPEQKSQGLDLINSYDEAREKAQKNAEAQKVLGVEVKLAGNAAQNASPKIAGNTKELKENESAAQKAAKAQKGYFDSLNQDVLSANERLAYMNLGFSKETIDQINKLQEAKQKALGDGVTAIVTTEEINQIVRAQNALDAVKDKEDEITQAKREQNKEAEKSAKLAEKQAVIMAGTNEQTKNMLKVYQAFRNAGVDDVKARVLTAQVGREGDFLNKNLFGSHTDAANRKTNSGMISWQGSRSKSLTQYLQGQGVLDKKGNIEQTQEALNAQAKFFIQEIMTEKRYSPSKNALLGDNSNYRELEKVFGKNAIAWDYNGKNIGSDKAAKNLTRQDNYYNSLNKILGGDPENALSSIKDLAKYDDEAYKARKDLLDRIEQLQSQYDTEAVARSKARDEEILQATILSQNDLIPKIKERYDAEDKLAKLQQEFDVEGHKWTEERKLQYTYDTNVLRLTAEGKFSEDQKKIFEKALKEQYEQEKAFAVLARETRIFQAQQSYMHEIDAMQERYRLEIREIDRIADLKERAAMREAAAAKFTDDYEKKRKVAEDNFNQVAAKIGGFEEYYAIQKEMEDAAAVMKEARKYELISEEEHKNALIEIEKRYVDAKRSLNLSYGQQIAGSMADMFKQQGDEQNKFYKATLTAEKSFAIVRSMIAIKAGIAQAANNPWPLNLAAMAGVAAQTASIVSDIKAIHMEGFANGGFTGYGGKYEPAGIVHKWEGVLTKEEMMAIGGPQGFEGLRKSIKNGSYANGGVAGINAARDTHRVGMGAVNAINNGGSAGNVVVQPQINITTPPGYTAEQGRGADGSIDINILRQIAREEARGAINSDASNPNSGFSKAMKRHFTVSTKRF